ncbi:hypothetical protein B0H13DRAFT_2116546 [Mycena leptocephala]|nr:hypothetical protein B0H13DRAFT_2116546 [Mycena leptocephala]
MPPRAKGRRSQAKPDLASAQRNSPRLPQELIDAIIDHLDTSLTDQYDWHIFPDRKTLRCCALVARALVRPSQMKLFSTVDLRSVYLDQPPDERPRLPHVGHYVKNLFLTYRCARSNSLDRILSYLPKLTSISLHPWHSFLAAFSLSSLRRLALRDHKFNDALELQSLLSNSLGLEELVLHGIQFTNTRRGIHDMPTRCMEAVLNSSPSWISDIFVHFAVTAIMNPLFWQMHALQELTLIADYNLGNALCYFQPLGLNSHIVHFYPDTSLLPEGLHNLNLQIDSCYTLSLYSPAPELRDQDWLEADSLLAEVGSELEELHVNFNRLRYQQQDEIERVLRASMPTMNAKGILCIFF